MNPRSALCWPWLKGNLGFCRDAPHDAPLSDLPLLKPHGDPEGLVKGIGVKAVAVDYGE